MILALILIGILVCIFGVGIMAGPGRGNDDTFFGE